MVTTIFPILHALLEPGWPLWLPQLREQGGGDIMWRLTLGHRRQSCTALPVSLSGPLFLEPSTILGNSLGLRERSHVGVLAESPDSVQLTSSINYQTWEGGSISACSPWNTQNENHPAETSQPSGSGDIMIMNSYLLHSTMLAVVC